jgi:hypothetical protein
MDVHFSEKSLNFGEGYVQKLRFVTSVCLSAPASTRVTIITDEITNGTYFMNNLCMHLEQHCIEHVHAKVQTQIQNRLLLV